MFAHLLSSLSYDPLQPARIFKHLTLLGNNPKASNRQKYNDGATDGSDEGDEETTTAGEEWLFLIISIFVNN